MVGMFSQNKGGVIALSEIALSATKVVESS